MRAAILPTLAFALAAAACVGTLEPTNGAGGGGDDDPGGPTTGTGAQALFDSEVLPVLQTASCIGCHTGAAGTQPTKFMGTGPTTYYSTLVSLPTITGNFVPAQARLLTQGAHSGARAFTTAEADTISTWLLAEAGER